MTTDPLLVLRLPEAPIDPDRTFRARLRLEIADALHEPEGGPVATTLLTSVRSSLIPYLCCRDAAAAIDWYRDAFGAVLHGDVFPMGDGDDRVGHAELRIGTSTIFLSDEWPEGEVFAPATYGGSTTGFVLTVEDVDATFAIAVELGARVQRPIEVGHGSRSGWIVDPFGHRWNIATPLPDPSGESDATAGADAGPAPAFRAENIYEEIGYYVIGRPDLNLAKEFYGSVFGWEFADENLTPDGHRGAHVTSSKVPFGLTEDPSIQGFNPWFRVTDLTSTLARIRAAGGQVLEETGYDSGGGARCQDNQGVEFELYQPAPGY